MNFETLIKELGNILGIDLSPDEKGHCRIVFEDQLTVQLEKNKKNGKLLVVAILGRIDPGAFRTKVLEGALIINSAPPPFYGILSFSSDTDQLVLHENLDYEDYDGKKLDHYLKAFHYKGCCWLKALKSNSLPDELFPDDTSLEKQSLFGIQ